jgi:hypothetical protein
MPHMMATLCENRQRGNYLTGLLETEQELRLPHDIPIPSFASWTPC